MAIKDQCLKCKWYSSVNDQCNVHRCSPSYDHRSCMDYVKVERIDLSKHDGSQSPAPAPSRPSPQRPNPAPVPRPQPRPKPKRQANKKLINTLLILTCSIVAAAACFFLAFGWGFTTGLGVLFCFVPAALFAFTFVNTDKPIFKIIYLCLFAGLLIFGISKTNYRKANREEVDFAVSKRGNTIQSYENYIASFPESPWIKECTDSLWARKMDRAISTTYSSISNYKDFVESCESEVIRDRAIQYLDKIYTTKFYMDGPSKDEFMEFYCEVNPQGPHAEEFKAQIYEKLEKKAFDEAVDALTIEAFNKYLKEYPNGPHAKAAREQIALLRQAAENAKYANNSLSTGSQPYANYYGRNGGGNCAVIVDASGSTDVVVIVKHNNSDGRVAGHAYIRRGSSYTIHLSPGTYQVFFYYGNGWNPNKKLSNGLTGGFTSSEQYGKDNPINLSYSYSGDYIYYDQMQYSLQSVVGGNFSMKGSNANDVF